MPTNFSLTDPSITYTWSYNGIVDTSLTTSSINVTNYGTYSVTINNLGCISTKQIEVTLDTADIPIGTNGECVGVNYILTASPINGSFTPDILLTYLMFGQNASGTVVGTNANTFNVSEYVRNNTSTTFPSTFYSNNYYDT